MPRPLEVDCEEINHEEATNGVDVESVVDQFRRMPHWRVLAICMEFAVRKARANRGRLRSMLCGFGRMRAVLCRAVLRSAVDHHNANAR